MPLHSDSHLVHTMLRAVQTPGDAVYRGAILAVAFLLLLTAWI